MDENELQELLQQLSDAGLKAWPYVELPHAESKVRAGTPSELGDVGWQVRRVAECAAAVNGCFTMEVIGDSMVDLKIEEGDEAVIDTRMTPRDGDVVFASIDDEFTIKTYFTDDKGRTWLLPANSRYRPILFSGKPLGRIWGVMVQVTKRLPRMSYRNCQDVLKAAGVGKPRVPSDFEVQRAIHDIGLKVRSGRHWYALMRALIDVRYLQEGEYQRFCDKVRVFAPLCQRQPDARQLSRLAVGSFAKPVVQWNKNNAPVEGAVFDEYLQLAQEALQMLQKEEEDELPF